MTNGDKIRQMSNEELADFIHNKTSCNCCAFSDTDNGECLNNLCEDGIKAYLDMEVEE